MFCHRNNRVSRRSARPRSSNKEVIVCCEPTAARAAGSAAARAAARSRREAEDDPAEAEDVIDLGAPVPRRAPRRGREPCVRGARGVRGERASRLPYTPNPRLYPGPTTSLKPKTRLEGESGRKLKARRKRVFQRPVPNARLYRPAPPRPPAPPAWPRVLWFPPVAPAPRALDTASRAALRLGERRPTVATPTPPLPAPLARSRHLVVTLPTAAAAGGDAPRRSSRPRTSPPARRNLVMDAAKRHSTSPEDCSDGNDTHSAPSEFLAEFLSAIMQRQYAEALKYCRLILQYEPHNATARGFYPLLQHKLHDQQEGPAAVATGAGRSRWLRRGSSSEEASALAHSHAHEVTGAAGPGEEMQQGSDSDSDSERSECGSQSSLELDSDAPPAPSGGRPAAPSLSRRTDPTDSASGSSGASSRTSGASGGCWETSGSASRSDADDNGNALAPTHSGPGVEEGEGEGAGDGDVENDNASASLRRLRAQFACSIK